MVEQMMKGLKGMNIGKVTQNGKKGVYCTLALEIRYTKCNRSNIFKIMKRLMYNSFVKLINI